MKLSEQLSAKTNRSELLTAKPRAEKKTSQRKRSELESQRIRKEKKKKKKKDVKIGERRVYKNVGMTGEPFTRYLSPAVAGYDSDTCHQSDCGDSR